MIPNDSSAYLRALNELVVPATRYYLVAPKKIRDGEIPGQLRLVKGGADG